jgi:hypothetical protein
MTDHREAVEAARRIVLWVELSGEGPPDAWPTTCCDAIAIARAILSLSDRGRPIETAPKALDYDTPKAAASALLAALRKAADELNAIRARDGAPQHIDWHRGNPIQTDACTHEYWDALTEECFAAIARAEAAGIRLHEGVEDGDHTNRTM